MRQNTIFMLMLWGIMLFASGCVSEPGLDKGKFSGLNKTAQELKTVITSTRPCDMLDGLVQKLASQISVMKEKAISKPERDLIAAYTELLATYKDGLLLCQTRTLLAEFPFLPKGRIYVPQELDPVVEKYGLSTERHLYKPTGQYWRSVSSDSIQVIWENAEARTKVIDTALKYN
jgi:hypothetical protein